MRWPLVALSLAACSSSSSGAEDPDTFTGTARRFVVDSITLPLTNKEARAAGFDLDGNGTIDNQLGMVIGSLASGGDVTDHGDDQLASGVIASSVEIVADDELADPTVAVRYLGADGEDTTTLAGSFTDGVFATRQPGAATVHVPVFVDADPTTLVLDLTQIELVPDGHGGYNGRLGGAADRDAASAAAYEGARQMLATAPADHRFFLAVLDANDDYVVTRAEWDGNSLIESLFTNDLQRDEGAKLSFGFAFHVAPCADGNCRAQPADSCFDRVRDGDETDVDCGGACKRCQGGDACTGDADCATAGCDAGTCLAASCSDAVKDGFESDVDCGAGCGVCATGATCLHDGECASGQCGEPCTGTLCIDDWATCR